MQTALTAEGLYPILFRQRRLGIHEHEAKAAARSLRPCDEPMIKF